jgi:hypothetical protein
MWIVERTRRFGSKQSYLVSGQPEKDISDEELIRRQIRDDIFESTSANGSMRKISAEQANASRLSELSKKAFLTSEQSSEQYRLQSQAEDAFNAKVINEHGRLWGSLMLATQPGGLWDHYIVAVGGMAPTGVAVRQRDYEYSSGVRSANPTAGALLEREGFAYDLKVSAPPSAGAVVSAQLTTSFF